MKTIIRVTLKDIATGISADCQECPVAIAIKRAFDADWVEVDYYKARLWIEEKVHNCILSQEVANWIANFDTQATVSPFSFKLTL